MEWFLPVGPLKGFGHRGIKIRHKSQYACLQILHRGATDTLEELPHQNTEPYLNLVHPRGMFWGVVKHDPMRGIGQKRRSGRHRLEDTPLALLSEIVSNPVVL